MRAPPLVVLGVSRSGTTLLRVMLDRHSRLAIPDESFFIPPLARRHRGRVDPDAFVDDVRRLPRIREWGVDPAAVRARLVPGATTGEAIAAIYETYAADRGKSRWGDKTPMYMQYLPLLERLFPDALYVHLIRDGRDAAISFLSMPRGIATEMWGLPATAADFACQWRTDVEAAEALGRRVGGRYLVVRYEDVVDDAAGALRRVCGHAGLSYEEAMVEYVGEVDVSWKPHQQSLERPPTRGLRDWRADMSPEDAAAFEDVAGALLARLGYETLSSPRPPSAAARARLARYRALTAAWRASAAALQRSPLWRRRHPPLI